MAFTGHPGKLVSEKLQNLKPMHNPQSSSETFAELTALLSELERLRHEKTRLEEQLREREETMQSLFSFIAEARKA